MTYHYGGHPDDDERVYWLDELGRPVARMLFVDFSRLCRTGASEDVEGSLRENGIAVPALESLGTM